MPRVLHEVVKFRGDKLFNGAANIDWFGNDEARTRLASGAFVFHGPQYHGVTQADVGTDHGHRLVDTASFVQSIVRRSYGYEDQPFTLAIAGYGTGKSQLGLTIASLLNDPQSPAAESILAAIEAADAAIGRDVRLTLQESGQPCLVVAINGMQSSDLTAQITQQILRQVRARGLDTSALDELRPRFSQAASLVRMANQQIADELFEACNVASLPDILAALEQQDESIYKPVHEVFAAHGMSITALRGESLGGIVSAAVQEYCGDNKPFRTLLILFDEFGKYMEFATVKPHIAGGGVLQDLFEAVQDHSGRVCFAAFIQFELSAYVQRIAPEFRNEILRYVTRYQGANRVSLSINLETLIANLMENRDPAELDRRFGQSGAIGESAEIIQSLSHWYPLSCNHRLWGDVDQFHNVIRKGCWPLSPYATWFLYHLAAAGKHLQERSALALLGQLFDRFVDYEVPDGREWALVPVDFWCDDLQHELVTSEEGGQQGSITLAYASVEARYGAQLSSDATRLLRAVVLASKLGLRARHRADAVDALARLAGVSYQEADDGLGVLRTEYNVLDWDEASKQFDIFGESASRTQFLAFIRHRVASAYDETGKAALFASKGATWCDLLADVDCEFAEENKIMTREWRYVAVTSNFANLPLHVKLAMDRWRNALQVDEPRGTVIYCYLEPSRDLSTVELDVAKVLRAAAKEVGVAVLPILVILLPDDDGGLGQALAELAVLDASLTPEDRAKFGNLIAAHLEKQRNLLRSQVDTLIKQRHYITGLKEDLEARRLSRAGTELFMRIYKSPINFPFDGFNTARRNAAESCYDLSRELLLGKLDYDAVLSKPIKVKNRAVTVLQDCWGIFAKDGSVRTRPSHPVLRTVTAKWDDMLSGDERRLPVAQALHELCKPPYGANIASAGLLFGAFVAARLSKLVVVRAGQQCAVSQWLQEDLFKGKFIDLAKTRDVDLVMLGEASKEWDRLLDEWEDAESYSARIACQERGGELKGRVPVPPALVYQEIHLQEKAQAARRAIAEMDSKQNDAHSKLESGEMRADIGLLSWGAALLSEQYERMTLEPSLWDEQQLVLLPPHLDRTRQLIIQLFPNWLAHQAPPNESPDAVSKFKFRLINQTGKNLRKLGLEELSDELEKRAGQIVRNVETVAEAQQLIRSARSWLETHRDAGQVFRVAESRSLMDIGKDFGTKLVGMSRRIDMPQLGEVRSELSEFLKVVKAGIEQIEKRAGRFWKSKLQSNEDLDGFVEEADALITAFDGCENDLRDLHVIRAALRRYREDYRRLDDNRLTWEEFERLGQDLPKAAADVINEKEVPWPPAEVIAAFVESIAKQRKQASTEWLDAVEAAAAGVEAMSASDANRLYERANAPPAALTEPHAKRLAKVVNIVVKRLDALKLEWLVEKFRELSTPLRKKFLQLIESL